MSGVTTSSLSLAWSLRNWVILDYEEPFGLTVRPWAPFLLTVRFHFFEKLRFHFLNFWFSVSWEFRSWGRIHIIEVPSRGTVHQRITIDFIDVISFIWILTFLSWFLDPSFRFNKVLFQFYFFMNNSLVI